MFQLVLELGHEAGVLLAGSIGFAQLGQGRNQGFCDENTAIGTEVSAGVGKLIRHIKHLHVELRQ